MGRNVPFRPHTHWLEPRAPLPGDELAVPFGARSPRTRLGVLRTWHGGGDRLRSRCRFVGPAARLPACPSAQPWCAARWRSPLAARHSHARRSDQWRASLRRLPIPRRPGPCGGHVAGARLHRRGLDGRRWRTPASACRQGAILLFSGATILGGLAAWPAIGARIDERVSSLSAALYRARSRRQCLCREPHTQGAARAPAKVGRNHADG